jgi:hypothetical protein
VSAFCLLVVAPVVHSQSAAIQDLRIENVTIISPERTREIDSVTVTIHAGRIRGIFSTASAASRRQTTAAQRLDGTNLYLIPGLIDSHVHLDAIPGMTDEQEKTHPDIARATHDQIPRSYLYSGFTTLIDLISTPEAMARWKSHDPVPDTYFCGGAALMDGYPSNYLPKEGRFSAMPYLLVEARSSYPSSVCSRPQQYSLRTMRRRIGHRVSHGRWCACEQRLRRYVPHFIVPVDSFAPQGIQGSKGQIVGKRPNIRPWTVIAHVSTLLLGHRTRERRTQVAGRLEHHAHFVEFGEQRIALDRFRRAHDVGDPHLDPVRIDVNDVHAVARRALA